MQHFILQILIVLAALPGLLLHRGMDASLCLCSEGLCSQGLFDLTECTACEGADSGTGGPSCCESTSKDAKSRRGCCSSDSSSPRESDEAAAPSCTGCRHLVVPGFDLSMPTEASADRSVIGPSLAAPLTEPPAVSAGFSPRALRCRPPPERLSERTAYAERFFYPLVVPAAELPGTRPLRI